MIIYFHTGQVNAWTALPSSYTVEVEDEHDIANAVKFAKDHNLRLVVKGTGKYQLKYMIIHISLKIVMNYRT